jgi:Na+/melibiose symporter-like transporter
MYIRDVVSSATRPVKELKGFQKVTLRPGETKALQTAHAQAGILLTASVYAGVAFFAAAGCLLFYPITREVNQKIANELAERRKTFAAQANA